MKWMQWCCVESAQQSQEQGKKTASYATGLHDGFDVMDGASDGETRVEFVVYQRTDDYTPAKVPASTPAFSESSMRPQPIPTLAALHDDESPSKGPTLLAQLGSPHGWSSDWKAADSPSKRQVTFSSAAASQGLKVGRDGLKAQLKAAGAEPDDTGKHGSTTRSRGSRISASTISVEECMPSDSEVERTSTTARGSTRGTRSLASVSTDEESQRMILYPWEIEAMVAQATVPTCSRSRPSSPIHTVGSEFGKKKKRGDGADAAQSDDDGIALPGQCQTDGELAAADDVERKLSDLTPLVTDVGRAKMFYVQLERREDMSRLGLDTRPLVSDVTGALSVERIRVGGLVDEWNRANSRSASEAAKKSRKHRIRKGDLIVEVNGLRGSSDGMYKVITSDTSLKLLVMRLPPRRTGPSVMASSCSMAESSLERETQDEERASN